MAAVGASDKPTVEQDIRKLLSAHPLVSDQVSQAEVSIVLHELARATLGEISGSVVEFGCYTGTTALFMARLLAQMDGNHELHVYDSFEGLPPKAPVDQSPLGEQFVTGELRASKATLIKHFRQAHLPLPVIRKGWFASLAEQDVPDQIVFAFLDGDYYESITTSLRLIWPKLTPRAIVVVDDYGNQALPGARRAVDEWLRNHPGRALQLRDSLAILRP